MTLLAIVGFLAWVLPARAEERVHVVQKNETLTSIARDHEVPVTQLARRNGLKRDAMVRTGMRLVIPGRAAEPPQPAAAGISRSIRQVRVEPHRWHYIVIHHSGSDAGSAQSMDRYHRQERHMENGLAYHFVIGNGQGMPDGQIVASKRWFEQLDGGHVRSEELNQESLGICLVGNFDKTAPSPAQMRSLRTLVEYLMRRCELSPSSVKTHQQINPVFTRCPGSHFPSKSFVRELSRAGN